jgi:hypothetical protein
MKQQALNNIYCEVLKGMKQSIELLKQEQSRSSNYDDINRIEDKIKRRENDINDLKHYWKLYKTPEDKYSLLVETVGIEVLAKWMFLRQCIDCLNVLKALIPGIDIFSNHWLSLRKPINLSQLKTA